MQIPYKSKNTYTIQHTYCENIFDCGNDGGYTYTCDECLFYEENIVEFNNWNNKRLKKVREKKLKRICQ